MTTGGALLARHRRKVLAACAVLGAAGAAALVPRPAAMTGAVSSAFAAIASGAIVTVVIMPFVAWRRAARPRAWVGTAAVSLVLGVASFAAGGYTQRSCTARYGDRPTVIGMDLTALGTAYRDANPELSTDDLLFDAAGVPERIWTRSSINRCAALLSSTYFLWVPFLTVCLVATAQCVPVSVLAPIRWEGPTPPAGAPLPILYDAFISYRHEGEDQRFARDLLSALETSGYRVAIDDRDFRANAAFLQEMERAIKQSRFTLAVISRRYLDSGNTEEEAVITKVLDMRDRKRRLIPLVIEPVTLPVWLYDIVGIDWTKADPLVDPFERLKATLGPGGAA